MPLVITNAEKQEQTLKLREFHGACAGVPLWAWDSESKVAGFEQTGGIPRQSLTDKDGLQFAIMGPPATLFTLAVTFLAPKGQPNIVPPTPIEFELLAGHGRAAFRVVHALWSPPLYLGDGQEAWIFQFNGLLASSWWLFAKYNGTPYDQANVAYKVLIERATVLLPTDTRVGPNVAVIP